MRQASLSDLLPDFGTPQIHSGVTVTHVDPHPHPTLDMPAPVDIDKLVAMAVAKAEDALEATLTAAHTEALAAERQALADEARAMVETLGTDLGTAIADRAEKLEHRLYDLMGDAVARIVSGLLSDELQKRSLAALERVIRDTLADAEAVRISVRGPLSLYEPLKAALGTRAANLDFAEAASLDLTMTVNDTVVETRMSEWSAALSEVLA